MARARIRGYYWRINSEAELDSVAEKITQALNNTQLLASEYNLRCDYLDDDYDLYKCDTIYHFQPPENICRNVPDMVPVLMNFDELKWHVRVGYENELKLHRLDPADCYPLMIYKRDTPSTVFVIGMNIGGAISGKLIAPSGFLFTLGYPFLLSAIEPEGKRIWSSLSFS